MADRTCECFFCCRWDFRAWSCLECNISHIHIEGEDLIAGTFPQKIKRRRSCNQVKPRKQIAFLRIESASVLPQSIECRRKYIIDINICKCSFEPRPEPSTYART